MRTNIEIDDALIAKVMAATGIKTKREAVDTALRETLRLREQGRVMELFGKINWVGDLDEMRRD